MMVHLPAGLCLAALGMLLIGEHRESLSLRIVAKTFASFAFVAYARALGAWTLAPAGPWIVTGLVLSVVGDLALLSRAKPAFLGGLVAFLLAHVAYVIAFVKLGVSVPGLAVMTPPVALFSALIWHWLSPHTGELTRPVVAYIVVISAMVTCAAAAWFAQMDATRSWLLGAAILFFLSDLCVARDRFVAPGVDNRSIGLPLYYVSQLLFGYGIAHLAS